MQVTFLGTGTSQGVPFIGCNCAVCTSTDKRDNRLRSSVWIHDKQSSLVIDTGPDFRYQMLREKVHAVNAVLFTHGHKDHVAGLDDIRAYNYWQNSAINIYADDDAGNTLKREFHYAFSGDNYPGIPQLSLHTITGDEAFIADGISVQPIKVMHYHLGVLGYRINDFSYITDANYIAPDQIARIYKSKILVLNALRHEPHISHFTLSEAINMAKEVKAERTYFTHISHQLGLHKDVEEELPENMFLAYDGLRLDI